MNNKFIKFSAIFVALLLLSYLWFIVPVKADAVTDAELENLPGTDLVFGDVYCVFLKIMTWFFSVSLVIAIIVLIINGLQYIFSSGDSGTIMKVHKNLSWVLVGVVVILLSASILIMIANFLGVFTASFEVIILPAEAVKCEVVWWADLIGAVFDWAF
jgi:hypothetical protein